MDIFNNVLEGTRQYFMGVPKATPSQNHGIGAGGWVAAVPPEEGAPAQSGAPAPSSRPPSAAAPTPRPPSEPLEPEPHIIHKATVMREALEKRRERPEPEDDETEISPPSHIIRKHALPSPAPAPSAPCPSPARPPSVGSKPPAQPQETPRSSEEIRQTYRPSSTALTYPTVRQSEQFAARAPEQYPMSRPPDPVYPRYRYESGPHDSSRSGSSSTNTSTTAHPHRQSPQQTYARISSTMPQHPPVRLRESAPVQNSTVQRERYATNSLPPHNDRVPPIHHPSHPVATPVQRVVHDSRSSQLYPSHHRVAHESTHYARTPSHYERHAVLPTKYDTQTYPGYRPPPSTSQSIQNHRIDLHSSQYKHSVVDTPSNPSPHYPTRPPDRARPPDQARPHDSARLPSRIDYPNMSRVEEDIASRNQAARNYQYASTSGVRYGQSATVPTGPQRTPYRQPSAAPKPSYEFATSSHTPQSPARSASKPTFANQQARMTVSVTSLVNQMNQTKQKRESPLDLSVKTVKNSADSSTTQDDADSSMDSKSMSLQFRAPSSARQSNSVGPSYVASHKVDFAPDFHSQYRERNNIHVNNSMPAPPAVRYNGTYELYGPESRHTTYPEQNKLNVAAPRHEYPVQRVDLTRPTEERPVENRLRDDGYYVSDSRRRLGGPITNNIPEKIMRYETWSADSRIDRMNRSAKEQHELMSQPVYSYRSHKQLEAFQNEQKRSASTSHRDSNSNSKYPYNVDHSRPDPSNHGHYIDRNPPANGRHIIQKISHHRDSVPIQRLDHHSGVPADKRVLSILRNSLETKHTGFVDPSKTSRHIPDLIVIDDVDDSVIEITDLTKENDVESTKAKSNIDHNKHIRMPKAVDSLPLDNNYQSESKSKSPEDVSSRIRTKGELKGLPPTLENSIRRDINQDALLNSNNQQPKLIPKSQKQHLFNQLREDSLRYGSVHSDSSTSISISELKSEPMNIEEIEKDAVLPIKLESIEAEPSGSKEDDLDWGFACDSFMEQLKTGCHKKKPRKKRTDADSENKSDIAIKPDILEDNINSTTTEPPVVIKQELIDDEELKNTSEDQTNIVLNSTIENGCGEDPVDVTKIKKEKDSELKNVADVKKSKEKVSSKSKESPKVVAKPIKEESESTDDDEPLIKSKLLKEKEKSEQMKYQLLKDLSEKSAYVKLECCDVDVPKGNKSEVPVKEKSNAAKSKSLKNSKNKGKSNTIANIKNDKSINESTSDSDSDVLSVASRLRTRKSVSKSEEPKSSPVTKSPAKSKKSETTTVTPTVGRKEGFGDGSDFHPGWEEELYRFKRSLRMPTRLIAIPRGRSGGPFGRPPCSLFNRGSTSLPDLDPAPLSPAPSSVPSAATDDLFARRPDKHAMDSDLESNSSSSALNKLHYDSEASTSTVFSSSKTKKKGESIIDKLIQKCGKKEDKRKTKEKEDIRPKVIPKSSNELLPTPSLGLVKTDPKGKLCTKKEKLMEDIFYLGAFRKDTVSAFRNTFIKNTDGLIGATEEFAPVVLKSRTRTESRVLKQRATIKEIFGDERPASAPPTSCREDEIQEIEEVKKEEPTKMKRKPKKIIKDKLKRRSSSIRDGLRSTKSLKRNDAKGRLLRLKKRNNLMKTIANKRLKDFSNLKKKDKTATDDKDSDKPSEQSESPETTEGSKKRFKRLFGRRKFSSGFDYIRKKKKIIRREDAVNKRRRIAAKPRLESETDIHKEIKSWFINKSIGETPLHRAARLGYTDCVAYCLEKLNSEVSSKDNAGFTPLHVAAAHGHVRIARLLLQYGADVSAAAQKGIRPLHEACENSHVEMIRLLLSYGADPLLGTYSGQTPADLADGGPAKILMTMHIADVQGKAVEPWRFPPANAYDPEELGCDPLASPPPGSPPLPPDATIEIQCTDAPLPPFYSIKPSSGQHCDGLWCLLQDLAPILQIKSKESLLKQIHCGSGSPRELFREMRTQEFLERAQCHQLLGAGEKVNVRASKVSLVRVTDKLRQLLNVETVLVS